MNTDEKLLRLAERLLGKTTSGSLTWEAGAASRTFQAPFLNSTVRITESPSYEENEGPGYVLSIYDEAGNEIESITDHSLAKLKGGQAFIVFPELYREARRRALGVEKAIDNLLGQLDDE